MWFIANIANSPVARKAARRRWWEWEEGGDWSRARAVIWVGRPVWVGVQRRVWVAPEGLRRWIWGRSEGAEEAVISSVPASRICACEGIEESDGSDSECCSTGSQRCSTEQRPGAASASATRLAIRLRHFTCPPIGADAKHPLPILHPLQLPIPPRPPWQRLYRPPIRPLSPAPTQTNADVPPHPPQPRPAVLTQVQRLPQLEKQASKTTHTMIPAL